MDAPQQRLQAVLDALDGIILGKPEAMRLALCCLLARGHLLIEDIPGVGKTTMAQALAGLLGLEFRRVQFTSDLLPADIIGANVYSRGALFSQVVLADEINRASPKTQSALLEAMEEGRATVEGNVHELPRPFFVIATQNPTEQFGTFPLPESQLDRFLMRVSLGYPDRDAERRMLSEPPRRELIADCEHLLDSAALTHLQDAAGKVHVSDALLDYLLDLLAASRQGEERGLSPRAGLAIQSAAQAWALMQGRDHVEPQDVQAIAASVVGHRLSGDRSAVDELLHRVPVA